MFSPALYDSNFFSRNEGIIFIKKEALFCEKTVSYDTEEKSSALVRNRNGVRASRSEANLYSYLNKVDV